MTNVARIDNIISEINALDEKDKILLFRKMDEISANSDDPEDNEIPIGSAFGLWKGRDITKESLRKKAWMKE